MSKKVLFLAYLSFENKKSYGWGGVGGLSKNLVKPLSFNSGNINAKALDQNSFVLLSHKIIGSTNSNIPVEKRLPD